jgi:hypothetical protein
MQKLLGFGSTEQTQIAKENKRKKVEEVKI